MLKIGTEMLDDEVLLVLEGSLSGPWVAEVELAWQGATGRVTGLEVTVENRRFFTNHPNVTSPTACLSGDVTSTVGGHFECNRDLTTTTRSARAFAFGVGRSHVHPQEPLSARRRESG